MPGSQNLACWSLSFCNLFFCPVPSGTLALYIFILQHVSVAAAVASGVLLLRDARRLARTFDAQLADLRLLMILTLGFQTILPAQIALMSARGVNTPLGWYIVIAQMAGVLLAFMLVGGLVAALRSLLGEERCRAWRGDMALFNGIVTLCVTGFLLYHMVSAYPRIFCRPALAFFATPLLCLDWKQKKQRSCRPRCQIMRFCLKSRRKLPQRFHRTA